MTRTILIALMVILMVTLTMHKLFFKWLKNSYGKKEWNLFGFKYNYWRGLAEISLFVSGMILMVMKAFDILI